MKKKLFKKEYCIIDTNVLIVANGNQSEQASEDCISNAQSFLDEVIKSKITCVDNLGLIFDEYFKKNNRSGQPNLGDFFAKWLFDRQAMNTYCSVVEINQIDTLGYDFKELPESIRASTFDNSDRKFIAVAKASINNPIIYNATDSDWTQYKKLLAEENITVTELCL